MRESTGWPLPSGFRGAGNELNLRTASNLASDFTAFLDSVKMLNQKLHQDFILACQHYARAVKEVGVNSEMVFIRLVSAVEVLSESMTLDSKDDQLQGQNIAALIAQSSLPTEQQEELQRLFDVRKSRIRFTRFIERHSSGFFKGGATGTLTFTKPGRQPCMRVAILVILGALSLCAQNSNSGNSSDADPPVSQDDIRIVRRASELLDSPAEWNRADNRQCPADSKTYSLYCALEQATKEISKKFEHRGAAMQQARFVIDEDLAKGNHYEHRLMDYNNDPKTTFADVQRFFALLEERIQKHLDAQQRR